MHGDKVAAEVLVHTAYLEGYYQGYLNSLAKKGEKKSTNFNTDLQIKDTL